ncbi:MAG TPA: N-acetylmuramoyl-L-alanine amidase, partial [Gemmatimonadales bacterium]|nr:N-acetylmuramoyl-L-alanine amidase [Gemmatimonadales bacterium]
HGNTDGLTVGRALPGGTYHWFFPAGTRALVTGRINGSVRLDLSAGSAAWVDASEARPVGDGTPRPAVVGSITATERGGRAVIRIPVAWRVPQQVNEDDRSLRLRLYGAVSDINWVRYGPAPREIDRITWRQATADEVEIEVRLVAPLWGYRLSWDRNDLLLEVRPRPAVDPGRPLAGRRIVIDPGHPPAGAVGPSGMTEAEANLGVARIVRRLLEAEGAAVTMTRDDDRPLDLWPRVRLADSLDADLEISIHNTALPDGVNPFTNNGSSVFYFHPRSIPLARAIQAELVARLGLRDLGFARGDLALVRGTWMPSVLTEGLFMMVPEQEADLRSEAGRRRYAEAVVAGVRRFLAESGL